MGSFGDKMANIASKALETAGNLVSDATKAAKDAADNANEKRVVKQAEKKRAAAKNEAILALSDAAKDLAAYNANLTSSDVVRKATESIISEIEKMKDVVIQMTPETVVPILEEQKENWLNVSSLQIPEENYAQMELDKSEIIKRRKLAAKKCEKAIEVLKKRAEEEE